MSQSHWQKAVCGLAVFLCAAIAAAAVVGLESPGKVLESESFEVSGVAWGCRGTTRTLFTVRVVSGKALRATNCFHIRLFPHSCGRSQWRIGTSLGVFIRRERKAFYILRENESSHIQNVLISFRLTFIYLFFIQKKSKTKSVHTIWIHYIKSSYSEFRPMKSCNSFHLGNALPVFIWFWLSSLLSLSKQTLIQLWTTKGRVGSSGIQREKRKKE